MARLDLSDYFASQTPRHIRNRVGKGVAYRSGDFDHDPQRPNQMHLVRSFYLNFVDAGRYIRITLDNPTETEGVAKVATRLKQSSLHVPGRYKDVLKGVRLAESEPCAVEVETKEYFNSAQRSNNREKLFHALYQTAIAPVISAVLEEAVVQSR